MSYVLRPTFYVLPVLPHVPPHDHPMHVARVLDPRVGHVERRRGDEEGVDLGAAGGAVGADLVVERDDVVAVVGAEEHEAPQLPRRTKAPTAPSVDVSVPDASNGVSPSNTAKRPSRSKARPPPPPRCTPWAQTVPSSPMPGCERSDS